MVSRLLPEANEDRVPRWYFGGLSATLAQLFVYPIDAVKIGLQTEQILEKYTILRYTKYIVATQGMAGLYCGLLANMRQQFLFSTTRFGVHQKSKEILQTKEVPFLLNLCLSALSGACGAFIRNPSEIIHTRMAADIKLPPEKKFNYKSFSQALKFITLVDGYRSLYAGSSLTVARAVAFNTSQICLYDQFKHYLLNAHGFTDTTKTHITAGAFAGFIATILCQPVDVIKVRYMSRMDDFAGGIREVIRQQFQLGALGFYRGTLLTFLKIELQTIITLVGMEQMRLHYGVVPRYCTEEEEASRLIDFGECIKSPEEESKVLERLKKVKELGGHSKLKRYFHNIVGIIKSSMTKKEAVEEEVEIEEEEEEETEQVATEEKEEVEDKSTCVACREHYSYTESDDLDQ